MRLRFSCILWLILIAGCSSANQQDTTRKSDSSDIPIPPFASDVQAGSRYGESTIYFICLESITDLNQWYAKEFLSMGWEPDPDSYIYRDQFPTAYGFKLADPQDPNKGKAIFINMRAHGDATYVLIERLTYIQSSPGR